VIPRFLTIIPPNFRRSAMSDRRRFLKGLTSLPLATVLANPRLAAAISAGLQEVEAKLSDGRTIKAALVVPRGQANGSILLVHEWWGLV
jgi:carboxymethylenebutenolidase